MKPCGCSFCNDLRNIKPAMYIGVESSDQKLKDFIQQAKSKKQFIYQYHTNDGWVFEVINQCPVCGYQFTEEDYDSYL